MQDFKDIGAVYDGRAWIFFSSYCLDENFLSGQVGSLKICNAFYLLLPDPVIRRTSTDFEWFCLWPVDGLIGRLSNDKVLKLSRDVSDPELSSHCLRMPGHWYK